MSTDFFVAGLGCSAGGLQALIKFFKQIPENPGVAFVVVQHLLPTYRSLSKEILEKKTPMKAMWITRPTPVQPNCLYVMPENKLLKINQQQQLYLEPRPAHAKINQTIDIFFTSLAEARKEKAIGIVFSGTGKDGAEGVRAIHKAGGMVMVQEPFDAEFSSMPREAIRSDSPDFISEPDKIAKKLLAFIEHAETSDVYKHHTDFRRS